MDMSTELEKVEEIVEEKKSEIEQLKERVKNGQITIAEIGEFLKKFSERVNEKMEKMRDIDQRITDYKERIMQLEKEKQKLKEEIRELNITISELTDGIKAVMGIMTVSKISGKPISSTNASNRGKGFRVHVKTTEQGVKHGLVNVDAEFSSMAKAVYALQPSAEGRRTDFKQKLESWAKRGLIELQFL
jgi:predicted RNase H-like nuclease (RuvC/YqgF family)